MAHRAIWDDIHTGTILRCWLPGSNRKNVYAIVDFLIPLKEFTVKWSDGYKSSVIWTLPDDFELVKTVPASNTNWRKGTHVVCTYKGIHYGYIGRAVQDQTALSRSYLEVVWDHDPHHSDTNYAEFSSFVVIDEPIENVTTTLPSSKLSTVAPKVSIPIPPEQKIDWDAYHGFKKGPYIIK